MMDSSSINLPNSVLKTCRGYFPPYPILCPMGLLGSASNPQSLPGPEKGVSMWIALLQPIPPTPRADLPPVLPSPCPKMSPPHTPECPLSSPTPPSTNLPFWAGTGSGFGCPGLAQASAPAANSQVGTNVP